MNASPQSEVEIERLVTWPVHAFEAENATTLSTFAVERVREAASAVHEAWLLRRTDTQRVEVNQLALGKHLAFVGGRGSCSSLSPSRTWRS